MGHRANLIVVRGGRYDLWYTHWSANTLDCDLFWGPDHAVAFAEAQQPCGQDGWLDNVWAEGGAVIDTDARVLRVFGGEDMQYDVPLRRLYLALLGVVWEGWNVGWADEGIVDLADYVGYPRSRVLRELADEDLTPLNLDPPENLNRVDCIGSVRFADGALRLFPLDCEPADYLLPGSVLAESVDSQPGHDRLVFAELTSGFPRGGFHLDLASCELSFWTSGDQPDIQARVAERWPGWAVNWVRDRYEVQLAATARTLSFPERSPAILFAALRTTMLLPPRPSMVDIILREVKEDQANGKLVEVNPHSLHDDRVECPDDVRARTLHRAAVQLGLVSNLATGP